MSKPAVLTDSYKTPLHRARGLGAAHTGVGGFLAERTSWMALIPLSLWGGVERLRGGARRLLRLRSPTCAAR